MLPFSMMEVVQANPPANREVADHPSKWSHTEDAVLSLPLADWALSRSCSQVRLGVATSLHHLHPCYHGHFVQDPVGWG